MLSLSHFLMVSIEVVDGKLNPDNSQWSSSSKGLIVCSCRVEIDQTRAGKTEDETRERERERAEKKRKPEKGTLCFELIVIHHLLL